MRVVVVVAVAVPSGPDRYVVPGSVVAPHAVTNGLSAGWSADRFVVPMSLAGGVGARIGGGGERGLALCGHLEEGLVERLHVARRLLAGQDLAYWIAVSDRPQLAETPLAMFWLAAVKNASTNP